MTSFKRDLLEKLLCSIPDGVLVGVEWLAKLILLLAFLSLPVALASLHELEITHDIQPSADCISVMASNGNNGSGRVGCFASDFFSEWGNKLMVLIFVLPSGNM